MIVALIPMLIKMIHSALEKANNIHNELIKIILMQLLMILMKIFHQK